MLSVLLQVPQRLVYLQILIVHAVMYVTEQNCRQIPVQVLMLVLDNVRQVLERLTATRFVLVEEQERPGIMHVIRLQMLVLLIPIVQAILTKGVVGGVQIIVLLLAMIVQEIP